MNRTRDLILALSWPPTMPPENVAFHRRCPSRGLTVCARQGDRRHCLESVWQQYVPGMAEVDR